MDRVYMTIEEIQELRAEETAKVLNALDEVLTIESLLKDGHFEHTKEILYRDLKRVMNIGR